MSGNPHLLGDAAMREFFTNGYLVLKPDLSPALNQSIYDATKRAADRGDDTGNGLLASVPALHQVLDHPTVRGALSSVLGARYVLYRHRHCHYHQPGGADQGFHKDGQLVGNVRYHQPRWAMAFYYPQDTPVELGPTAIQPATQYYLRPDAVAPDVPLAGAAGTVVIVHYELWHRATANRSNQTRQMHKFLFARMAEPAAAATGAGATRGALPAAPPGPGNGGATGAGRSLELLWQALWRWYYGENGTANGGRAAPPAAALRGMSERLADDDAAVRQAAAEALGAAGPAAADIAVAPLAAALGDSAETVQLSAAYALGAIGEAAVPALVAALRTESAAVWQAHEAADSYENPSQFNAAYGLAAVGQPAVPALTGLLSDASWQVRSAAAAALGCMGAAAGDAVPQLTAALRDQSEWVRRNALDALGNTGTAAAPVLPAVLEALRDQTPVTRWSLSTAPFRENAATVLAKLGPLAAEVVPALIESVDDDNEYVRFWSQTALQRIGSPDAQQAVSKLGSERL